jgi:cyclo(L-tyrosyl-L-tyrosyl) synthase
MLMAEERFVVQPYTPHCRVIYGEGAHAVIGVSPGNSYFSAERVLDLARWGLRSFERVDLIYTDLHVDEMYEACGYTAADARRKAVKNLRGVRAKVNAAVQTLDPGQERLRAQPLSALHAYPAYHDLHDYLRERLETDVEFRAVCDRLVDRFVQLRLLGGDAPSKEQRVACLRYVCAEAPLFLDTPAILGMPSSLNCYHQLLPLAELLYARGPGLRASRNQGHAVLTPALAHDAAEAGDDDDR